MNKENSFSSDPSLGHRAPDPSPDSLFSTSREHLVLLRIGQLSNDAANAELPMTHRSPAYSELNRLWHDDQKALNTALSQPSHPSHPASVATLSRVINDHLEVVASNPSGRSQSLSLVARLAGASPVLLNAVKAACVAPQEPEHRQWMLDALGMSDAETALRTVREQLQVNTYPPDASRRELQRHLFLKDLYERAIILEQVQHHSFQGYAERFSLELGNALQFPPGHNTLQFLKDLIRPEHADSAVVQQAASSLISRLTDTPMPASAVETILKHPVFLTHLAKRPISELPVSSANAPAIHTAFAIARFNIRTLPEGADAIHGSLKLLHLLLQVPPESPSAFTARLLGFLRDADERDHTVGTPRQFWPHLLHGMLSSEVHRPTALYVAGTEMNREDSPWLAAITPLFIEQLVQDPSRVTTLAAQVGSPLGMERLVSSMKDAAVGGSSAAHLLLYKWRLMANEGTLDTIFSIPPEPSVYKAFQKAITAEEGIQ